MGSPGLEIPQHIWPTQCIQNIVFWITQLHKTNTPCNLPTRVEGGVSDQVWKVTCFLSLDFPKTKRHSHAILYCAHAAPLRRPRASSLVVELLLLPLRSYSQSVMLDGKLGDNGVIVHVFTPHYATRLSVTFHIEKIFLCFVQVSIYRSSPRLCHSVDMERHINVARTE